MDAVTIERMRSERWTNMVWKRGERGLNFFVTCAVMVECSHGICVSYV